jgi:hypothetical protein
MYGTHMLLGCALRRFIKCVHLHPHNPCQSVQQLLLPMQIVQALQAEHVVRPLQRLLARELCANGCAKLLSAARDSKYVAWIASGAQQQRIQDLSFWNGFQHLCVKHCAEASYISPRQVNTSSLPGMPVPTFGGRNA